VNRRADSIRKPRRSAKPASAEAVYERVFGAIVEHRIAPGAQLVEEKLSAALGASRARIRQVLARLAHEGIVTLQPNRGAFIAEPSIEQTRQVFELRRLIEPSVAQQVAKRIERAPAAKLRAHLAAEATARRANDRRALIRLSGEFHLLLAELHGNAFILKALRELESITSLAIHLYDAPAMPACRGDDHAALVAAIEARDAPRTARLMLEHLNEVESCLRLEMREAAPADLEDVFS
jgi:DNA-binding GntR family transcriptional regulator